jgi:hypothetical protein
VTRFFSPLCAVRPRVACRGPGPEFEPFAAAERPSALAVKRHRCRVHYLFPRASEARVPGGRPSLAGSLSGHPEGRSRQRRPIVFIDSGAKEDEGTSPRGSWACRRRHLAPASLWSESYCKLDAAGQLPGPPPAFASQFRSRSPLRDLRRGGFSPRERRLAEGGLPPPYRLREGNTGSASGCIPRPGCGEEDSNSSNR